ncbi:uncharacterized protein BT62DRAFT_1006969 [Guyanagaster necrorhizus]|uniref:DUF6535 domain-containing protein n=1 Tax=Guyanagaster necrorhizus TaxID=856835 RepID=A0A9P7VRD3_9AGAR|nr:uncharacterized protein BT62DRAFT_1006969 [Guyanagaster necrorhizus MCA 3950]KAG7445268.1 hypothetical protein BT62DRAFT_1006969 [Guyanagaster necrorhizus MCA 3950]
MTMDMNTSPVKSLAMAGLSLAQGASTASDSSPEPSTASFMNGRGRTLTELLDEQAQQPISRMGDPWEAGVNQAEKYDNEFCKGWKEDIDTLLVFAGLFSAAVTAFTVESYQWLQPNSSDISAQLLLQISRQLSDPNTTTVQANGADDFSPSHTSRRINVFWFLSLTLSLMTVVIGILCKQWLREYQKDPSLPYRESLALRQLRYESFEAWRVHDILATLPLLLQVALVLFLTGIMDLLWSLDNVVAAIVTLFIVLGFLMVVATTVLPCLVHLHSGGRLPCAYRSPQSWAFLQATFFLLRGFKKQYVRGDWFSIETRDFQNSFDRFAARGVSWLDEKFSQNLTMVRQLFHCISDLGWNNFRALECVPEVPIQKVSMDAALFNYLAKHHQNLDNEARLHALELLFRTISVRDPAAPARDVIKWDLFPEGVKILCMSSACSLFKPSVLLPHHILISRLDPLLQLFLFCASGNPSPVIPIRWHALRLIRAIETWTRTLRRDEVIRCISEGVLLNIRRNPKRRMLHISNDDEMLSALLSFIQTLDTIYSGVPDDGRMSLDPVDFRKWKVLVSQAAEQAGNVEARRKQMRANWRRMFDRIISDIRVSKEQEKSEQRTRGGKRRQFSLMVNNLLHPR